MIRDNLAEEMRPGAKRDDMLLQMERKFSEVTTSSTVAQVAAPKRESGIITEFATRNQELTAVIRRLVKSIK